MVITLNYVYKYSNLTSYMLSGASDNVVNIVGYWVTHSIGGPHITLKWKYLTHVTMSYI